MRNRNRNTHIIIFCKNKTVICLRLFIYLHLADVSNEASQSSSIQTMSSMFCTTPQPECQVAPCTNQKYI